ncbi:A/G-specific adenine glycosylase [Roseospirillum parvum]|nr:A/G-specific adenine glycosylase [Roseospirillum parvum]
MSPPPPRPDRVAPALARWYAANARVLPWRARPGEVPDPYRVWLSEIMLQQTTVATVGPYFHAFTGRWPDVHALAGADDQAILTAWAGLGYYARARNLIRCARVVAGELGGRFPDSEAGLAKLPGIGPYTAAAVAAIAFDRPAAVLDGNIERVMARLFAEETPLPAAKPLLRRHAAALTPTVRPGDHAQALMDLGALICTPRRPDCPRCPLVGDCRGHALGLAAELPRRAPKKAKPTRLGLAYVAIRAGDGAVLLGRRPPSGLLGGMAEVPGSDWTEQGAPAPRPPLSADWRRLSRTVRHTFTHFHLELTVLRASVAAATPAPAGLLWVPPQALAGHPLPTVMRKVLAAGLDSPGGKRIPSRVRNS